MSTVVRIDHRERALLEALQEKGVAHEVHALALGDAELVHDDTTLRIERKTWDDLWASIRDGRFREQRERLRSQAASPAHVVYVLEGSVPADAERCKICVGAWLNLMQRDGFRVVRTWDVRETAYWLSQVLRKLEAGEPWTPPAATGEASRDAHDHGLRLSVRRSGNLDRMTLMALQFAVLPGLSMELGRHMARTFGDWAALVRHLEPLDAKARQKTLAAVCVPGAKRAMGPKLAERLLDLLFAPPPKIEPTPDEPV